MTLNQKDLIEELKKESHVPPNILLYLFSILLINFVIGSSVVIVRYRNNICPYVSYMNRRRLQQVPTSTNEPRYKDTAFEL